jgi:hypothetical protein
MLGQDKTYDFLSPLCALLLLFQGDDAETAIAVVAAAPQRRRGHRK